MKESRLDNVINEALRSGLISPRNMHLQGISKGQGKGRLSSPSTSPRKSSRRPLQFWRSFNSWWRESQEISGKRPCPGLVEDWYKDHAQDTWGEEAPSLEETQEHSKCLRSTESIKSYFRLYRARKAQEHSPEPEEPVRRRGKHREGSPHQRDTVPDSTYASGSRHSDGSQQQYMEQEHYTSGNEDQGMDHSREHTSEDDAPLVYYHAPSHEDALHLAGRPMQQLVGRMSDPPVAFCNAGHPSFLVPAHPPARAAKSKGHPAAPAAENLGDSAMEEDDLLVPGPTFPPMCMVVPDAAPLYLHRQPLHPYGLQMGDPEYEPNYEDPMLMQAAPYYWGPAASLPMYVVPMHHQRPSITAAATAKISKSDMAISQDSQEQDGVMDACHQDGSPAPIVLDLSKDVVHGLHSQKIPSGMAIYKRSQCHPTAPIQAPELPPSHYTLAGELNPLPELAKGRLATLHRGMPTMHGDLKDIKPMRRFSDTGGPGICADYLGSTQMGATDYPDVLRRRASELGGSRRLTASDFNDLLPRTSDFGSGSLRLSASELLRRVSDLGATASVAQLTAEDLLRRASDLAFPELDLSYTSGCSLGLWGMNARLSWSGDSVHRLLREEGEGYTKCYAADISQVLPPRRATQEMIDAEMQAVSVGLAGFGHLPVSAEVPGHQPHSGGCAGGVLMDGWASYQALKPRRNYGGVDATACLKLVPGAKPDSAVESGPAANK